MFSCYEKLKAIAEACQAPYFPNVRAVVAAIALCTITKNRFRHMRPPAQTQTNIATRYKEMYEREVRYRRKRAKNFI